MKDRLLRVGFAGALVVHLGVIAAGGALSPYLGRSGEADPMRSIDVGLETPEPPPMPEVEKPIAPSPPLPLSPSPTHPVTPSPSLPLPQAPTRVAAAETPPPPRDEPGGALNLGTPGERGDIEGVPSGKTPVGWVPGADEGKGAGSGSGEGVGRPEPPPRPEPEPQPAPAPAPAPAPVPKPTPPQPRRVSARVCAVTRLRPNPHCPECVTVEVVEGGEPQAVCSAHKSPPPPPPQPQPQPEAPPAPALAPQPKPEPPLTPARLVRTVKPRYPESALRGDHEGAVSLKVDVRADGTCGDVEVVRSSGSRVLDAAAVKAVKRWRWEPAKRGDEPVASTARCRVRFELEE